MEVDGLPEIADAFGGLLVRTGDSSSFGIARVAGPANAPAWRYEPPVGGAVTSKAVAPDGTIYALESRYTGRTNTDWLNSIFRAAPQESARF